MSIPADSSPNERACLTRPVLGFHAGTSLTKWTIRRHRIHRFQLKWSLRRIWRRLAFAAKRMHGLQGNSQGFRTFADKSPLHGKPGSWLSPQGLFPSSRAQRVAGQVAKRTVWASPPRPEGFHRAVRLEVY